MQISAHPLKLCKSDKMQGAEIEDDGSVLKYMTMSEIEKQRSSLLIMTQRLVVYITLWTLRQLFFFCRRRGEFRRCRFRFCCLSNKSSFVLCTCFCLTLRHHFSLTTEV